MMDFLPTVDTLELCKQYLSKWGSLVIDIPNFHDTSFITTIDNVLDKYLGP